MAGEEASVLCCTSSLVAKTHTHTHCSKRQMCCLYSFRCCLFLFFCCFFNQVVCLSISVSIKYFYSASLSACVGNQFCLVYCRSVMVVAFSVVSISNCSLEIPRCDSELTGGVSPSPATLTPLPVYHPVSGTLFAVVYDFWKHNQKCHFLYFCTSLVV